MRLSKATTTDLGSDYRGNRHVYVITCKNNQAQFVFDTMFSEGEELGLWKSTNELFWEEASEEEGSYITFPVDFEDVSDFKDIYKKVKGMFKK